MIRLLAALALLQGGPQNQNPSLDTADLRWVAEHPVVRYKAAGNFAPFSFQLGVQQRGFSLDLARRILESKGVRLEPVHGLPLGAGARALKSGQVDLLLALPDVAADRLGLAHTRPYKQSRYVVFCREHDWDVNGVASLEGRTVAAVHVPALRSMLSGKVRDLRLLRVGSTSEAIDAVSDHRADAFVDELETGLFYLRFSRRDGIRVGGGISAERDGYVMAVREDWPQLRSILDRGIAELPRNTIDSLFEANQIDPFPDRDRDRILHWAIVVSCCVATGLLGYVAWTFFRRWKRLSAERQGELGRLPVGVFRVRYDYGEDGSIFGRKLLFASDKCLSMVGLSAPPTGDDKVFERFHPDDRKAFLEFGANRFAEPEKRVMDLRIVLPEGVRHTRLLCHPSRSGPSFLEWHGILVDVTNERAAQEARLLVERRLQHAQKLESLGVLGAGIAHDFNNSLMAILANLEFARLGSDEAAGSLERAIQATISAVDLTRQILAFSGRGGFEVRRLDLAEKVRENVGLFRASISRSIRLDVDLPARPLMINADPGQIQQVLMNLITNASEAIDGPGTIRVRGGLRECQDGDLRENRSGYVVDPGCYAWIQVADDGQGMEPEVLESLFEPFFTTKIHGRGLGMSAMQGILREHRGAILVESERGRGTVVTVLFPNVSDPATPNDEFLSIEHSMLRATESRQILVIEDEPMVRQSLCGILRSMGHLVHDAEDGPEGLKILRTIEGGVVVLLDLSLPGGMNGIDVLRAIRNERSDSKVVMVSGFSRQDIENQCGQDRPDDFLQKPFLVRDLQTLMTGLQSIPVRQAAPRISATEFS